MSRLLLLVPMFVVWGCGGSSSNPSPPSQAPTVAKENPNPLEGSEKWDNVTAKPVDVFPATWTLCRAPTAEDQKNTDEENKKHGPHAQRTIFMKVNPVGMEDFKAGKMVPVGTVVVKEKHTVWKPDTAAVALGAMIKREAGYDPQHGDWEYYYEDRTNSKKTVITRGKLDSCIACHEQRKATDYLFRTYLPAQN